ncbi:MAG: hypothetical protein EBY41_02050 [Proteobacteria bacterium]|nr:hypothetical protein [Pseudomonadota bacterium]
MKIAHEAPKSIFPLIQSMTDYDYALVHLFEEDEEYYDLFVHALNNGREVILDNSIFELGEAFDTDKYKTWIERLKPSWYIIPDCLEDATVTISNLRKWDFQHPHSQSIGVVQGASLEEVVWCYQEIEPHVDKVAISFDYSWFIDEELYGKLPNKYHYYMYGRDNLLAELCYRRQVINTRKPHHLLGCGLPQEFDSYGDYSWIDSIDTSNPVVSGLLGHRYNDVQGLLDKPSQKLYTMINSEVNDEQRSNVIYNVDRFRAICNSGRVTPILGMSV